jgi:hypothetical protein
MIHANQPMRPCRNESKCARSSSQMTCRRKAKFSCMLVVQTVSTCCTHSPTVRWLRRGGSFRMKQSAAVNATCKAAHHPINGPPRRCPTKSSVRAGQFGHENVLHARTKDSLTHTSRGPTWGGESRDYVPGRCQRKPVVQSCHTMEEGRQPHRYPRGSVHHGRRWAVGRSLGMWLRAQVNCILGTAIRLIHKSQVTSTACIMICTLQNYKGYPLHQLLAHT